MEYRRALQPHSTNIDTSYTSYSGELCVICGDENAKSAYGAQSCASCKIFFRRNAHLDLNTNQCKSGGKCNITTKTRHICRYCRLKKCFSIGMQKDLLRASHGAQGGTKAKKKLLMKHVNLNENSRSPVATIHSIDLLNHDRSSLTIEQWSLLSNIVHTYDSRSPIPAISHVLSTQAVFPLKARLKLANASVMDVLRTMYIAIEPFINIIPDFSSMMPHHQTGLLARNILNLGGFNCQFMMRETGILKDPGYSNSLSSTYGPWIFGSTIKITDDMDIDGTLFKLLIVILAFSTCSDVVIPKDTSHSNKMSSASVYDDFIETNYFAINTIGLLEIQNKYVELMFKYMIYRYSYDEAALRFANLIKNFLYESVLTAEAAEISRHDQMIQTLAEKTSHITLSEC